MQDLPQGADQEWITKAKEYIQYVRGKVLEEEDFLKILLSEVEQVAADRFQEKFFDGEREEI
jgi:hypothetical protein